MVRCSSPFREGIVLAFLRYRTVWVMARGADRPGEYWECGDSQDEIPPGQGRLGTTCHTDAITLTKRNRTHALTRWDLASAWLDDEPASVLSEGPEEIGPSEAASILLDADSRPVATAITLLDLRTHAQHVAKYQLYLSSIVEG